MVAVGRGVVGGGGYGSWDLNSAHYKGMEFNRFSAGLPASRFKRI